MKPLNKVLLTAACLTMMLSSCSDEPQGGPEEKGDSAYATLTLSLPVGSRSTTGSWDEPNHNTNSDDGYEIGKDQENNVGSVLIVLASKNDQGNYVHIEHNLADPTPNSGGSTNKPSYIVKLNPQNFIDHEGEKVYVFAFCNPTQHLIQLANTNPEQLFVTGPDSNNNEFGIGTVNMDDSETIIWKDNAFLMSNHHATQSKNPIPTVEVLLRDHNTPASPFELGEVEVSRTAVRFDFKPTKYENQSEFNRYPIYEQGGDKNTAVVAYIQLNGMALMNQAKNYYYLPRVSENKNWTTPEICKLETSSNWVVSPFFAQKTQNTLDYVFITGNYDYHCQPATGTATQFMDPRRLTYDSLIFDEANKNDPNNWTHPTTGYDKTGYYFWKYTTENTIPGIDHPNLGEYGQQRHNITTGVVFRGELQGENGSEIANAISAKKTIYVHGHTIYANLDKLKEAVVKNPVSNLANDFREAFGLPEGTDLSVADNLSGVTDLENAKGNAKEPKFGIYTPNDEGKYIVYYFYYNRHNDNSKNAIMGPMEFATVRNNVYKLSIAGINYIGHPGDPDDDPDPEDPDDPDESGETYFQVLVRVLPWVVRVNNIIL